LPHCPCAPPSPLPFHLLATLSLVFRLFDSAHPLTPFFDHGPFHPSKHFLDLALPPPPFLAFGSHPFLIRAFLFSPHIRLRPFPPDHTHSVPPPPPLFHAQRKYSEIATARSVVVIDTLQQFFVSSLLSHRGSTLLFFFFPVRLSTFLKAYGLAVSPFSNLISRLIPSMIPYPL